VRQDAPPLHLLQGTINYGSSLQRRDIIISRSFHVFTIGGISLQYVSQFKYLGHVISDNFTDDADVKREISNMFMKTNILIRKYFRRSVLVKTALFKSFCSI